MYITQTQREIPNTMHSTSSSAHHIQQSHTPYLYYARVRALRNKTITTGISHIAHILDTQRGSTSVHAIHSSLTTKCATVHVRCHMPQVQRVKENKNTFPNPADSWILSNILNTKHIFRILQILASFQIFLTQNTFSEFCRSVQPFKYS